MAQLRKDDVQELWNETPKHDWSNFRQTLEKHQGQKDNIEDSAITAMRVASQDLEKSGQNFPESFEKFYQVINQKVEASGRSTRNEGEGRTQGRDRDSGERGGHGDGGSQGRDSGERGKRGDGEERNRGGRK
jgi:hypothetical protein